MFVVEYHKSVNISSRRISQCILLVCNIFHIWTIIALRNVFFTGKFHRGIASFLILTKAYFPLLSFILFYAYC